MPRKSKLSIDEIVVSLKGMDFIDASGKFRPLTDKVWQEASDRLNGQMGKKYVYLYISKNRNAILKELLTSEELEKLKTNMNLKKSPTEESVRSNWSLGHTTLPPLRTQFVIPTEVWTQIKPQTRLYKNREYNVLKAGWADVLYAQLWDNIHLPCPFIFKNGRVSTVPGDYFFKIHAECRECNNAINLYSLIGPEEDGLLVHVSTYDTREVAHKQKRHLKGTERKNVVKELKGTSTYNWRREKADSVMEFGDVEPAHLYKESVLRKAKQLNHDSELGVKGVTDPLKSLINLKYGLEFAGCLKEIGIDRFFVIYWSPEQTYLYKKLFKDDRVRSISIDATGSVIANLDKPDGSKHAIFIYQAVTLVENKILPIFQMVSEKHDANMLSYWMREWLRSGVPCPREVVTDYSLALLNAAALAFNNVDLGTYVEQCISTLQSKTGCRAPACILRIDIAHLIKLVCRWKCFRKTPQSVKDFFVRCVGLLTNCRTIENFSAICTDILSVAFSITEDVTDSSDCCFAAQQRLFRNIKTIDVPNESLKNDVFLPFEDDEASDTPKTGSRLQSFLEKLESESRKLSSGNRPNPYFSAEFGKNLLRISKHFVLWTNVMTHEVATSARSEEYFRQLKRFILKGVKSVRVDKFLIMHLRSISGTVKLLNAPTADENEIPSEQKYLNAPNNNENFKNSFPEFANDSRAAEEIKSEASLDSRDDSETNQSLRMSPNANLSFDKENDCCLFGKVDLDSVPVTGNFVDAEKVTLLNEVETWKGLNFPPKKRGKYLTPCPDIENIHQRPIFDRAVPVLQNGSALPPLKVGQEILRVVNTCPFDSIVQSVLTAYRDWSRYHDYVADSVNTTFKFVKTLSVNGISQKIYTQRAEILCQIVMPKDGKLDCAGNVSTFVSRHLLKNEPSFTRHELCASPCGYEENKIFPVFEVNPAPFYAEGMRGLQNAVNEFCALPDIKCKHCKSDLIINTIGGSHIFIDIECLEWPELAKRLKFLPRTTEFTISEIPIDLQVCNMDYKLVAAIIYSGGSKKIGSSIGHYYPFVRRITGKWEIHDDLTSNKTPLLASARKLLQKWRIHMLYYVKQH